MRSSPGQPSHGFHFLRLAQLRFQRAALSNVLRDALDVTITAFVVGDNAAAEAHSNVGAVAALHLHFQPSPLFALLIFLQQALAETRIEKHVMIKVELHQVSLGVVTQHGGESGIRGQEPAAQ